MVAMNRLAPRDTPLSMPRGGEQAAAGPTVRFALLVGGAVFALLAIAHVDLFFLRPWHEYGDYAVEALQIELAAEGRAIHGSCSRFGFHQPGPAFFYLFALSEQVLHRWLAWVPSPHNAHALAALATQCLLLGGGLAIARSWVRQPLFLPLALLGAAVHFGLAGNAFISTWQPRLMLMPFFAFVVGSASVAAGRMKHLPFTIVAGSLLVHAHVSQPLYVLPAFCGAYGFAWWQARHQPRPLTTLIRQHPVAHLASAALLALFLLPFIIDLTRGAQSNLAQLLEFETSYHSTRKPLWKSLLFFAGFFGYVKKPEEFLTALGPDRSELIGERIAAYFIWCGIIIAVVIFLARLRTQRDRPERPFLLALGGLTVLTVLLSFYWGRAQVGRVFEYNGYFYYAIHYCILVLFCAAVSRVALPRPRWFGAAFCAAAGWLTWQTRAAPASIDYTLNLIPPGVHRVLQADPQPNAPKYLHFNRDDWGEAVSIGLALRRAGHAFHADADWGPKFAPDVAFEPQPPRFEMNGLSFWRLSRRGPSDRGVLIRDNLRAYFAPLPLDPRNTTIDCAENGNLELYTLFGFASPLHGAAWSIRPYAVLVCDSPLVPDDVVVTLSATPFQVPGEPPNQPMNLRVNGSPVFECTLTAPATVTARVPRDVWNAETPVRIVFHFPGAISPRERGLAMDDRRFSWNFEQMTFRLATEQPAAVAEASRHTTSD